MLENNHETDRRSVSATAVAAMEELRGGVYVTDSREELAARLAFSFEEAASENAEFLPGGERFSDAYDRIVAGFRSLVLEESWRTGLLVAHEGVNRLLLAHLCHAGLAGVAAFEQDLACINVLDIDVVATGQDLKIQRALIRAMNVTAYDYVKAGLPKSSLEHLFDIDFNGQRPHAREIPRS